MSQIQVVDAAMQAVLDDLLNGVGVTGPFSYRLYSNDLTPTGATVIGDLTEVAALGYSAQAVPQTGWTIGTASVGTIHATNADVAFVVSGAMVAFGYYVLDALGNLLWVEKFDVAINFGALGGTVTLTPTLNLKSPLV